MADDDQAGGAQDRSGKRQFPLRRGAGTVAGMLSGPLLQVLEQLSLRSSGITTLKDVPAGNGNWLAETAAGERVVLRRYDAGTTAADLSYEHAVLRHLAAGGWVVPVPVGEAVPRLTPL